MVSRLRDSRFLQSLQVEIENHDARVMSVVHIGQELIDERHPQSGEFQELIDDLCKRWEELKDAVEARSQRLKLSELAQQVSFLFTVMLEMLCIIVVCILIFSAR